MRKKLLSVILAAILVMAYSVPVFATECETDAAIADSTQEVLLIEEETEVEAPEEAVEVESEISPKAESDAVSEYPDVQDAYDSFVAIEAAIKAEDYSTMKSAYDNLMALTESFDDDESADWDRVVEEAGYMKVLGVLIDAALIVYVNEDLCKEFNDNKNSSTAYEFVSTYELMKETVTEDYDGANLDNMLSADTLTALAEAEAYMPSDDVIAVYEAYLTVQEALIGPWPEDFDEAMAEFDAVLDIYNEFTEDDLAALAQLLELESGSDAYNQILDDWICINVLDGLVDVYEDYAESPNKETAQTFVEYYDNLFNDPEYDDPDLREMAYGCFDFDLDEKYVEAKALLNGGQEETPADKPENKKSPDTGDETPLPLLAGLMVLSGAAAIGVTAVRRRA